MPLVALTPECLDAARGIIPRDVAGRRVVSIPVFQNWIMERILGRAHWVTPIFWFGPLIAWGLWRSANRHGVARTIGYYALGWLIWTFIEYMLHRFVFHFRPKNEVEQVRAFLIHGYHHEFPDDPMRLVAPPIMSWGPALVFGTIFYFTFGAMWPAVFAGAATGYVAYDWIHYYTHHGRPRRGIGKWLRRYHMVHHHKHEHAMFGVSSPLWDFVFFTYRSLSGAPPRDREPRGTRSTTPEVSPG